MPWDKIPNRETRLAKAREEFASEVAAERRVRIRASRTEGTSPQPETVKDGLGIVLGALTLPCTDDKRRTTSEHSSGVG